MRSAPSSFEEILPVVNRMRIRVPREPVAASLSRMDPFLSEQFANGKHRETDAIHRETK